MTPNELVNLLCYGQDQDGTLVDNINWFTRYLSADEKATTLREFANQFSLEMATLTGEDE